MLEKINGETLRENSTENTIYMNGTEIKKLSQGQITIKNLAVVDVDYFWQIDSQLAN